MFYSVLLAYPLGKVLLFIPQAFHSLSILPASDSYIHPYFSKFYFFSGNSVQYILSYSEYNFPYLVFILFIPKSIKISIYFFWDKRISLL